MEPNKSHLKLIAGLLVLTVLVIIGVMFFMQNNEEQQPQATAPQQEGITKSDIPSDQVPSKIPANAPIENTPYVLHNYSVTTPEGQIQHTRTYQTEKTLAQNMKIFTDYLKAEKWEISNPIDQEDYKMVSGYKGNQNLQFEMNVEPVTGINTVTVSFTENLSR